MRAFNIIFEPSLYLVISIAKSIAKSIGILQMISHYFEVTVTVTVKVFITCHSLFFSETESDKWFLSIINL